MSHDAGILTDMAALSTSLREDYASGPRGRPGQAGIDDASGFNSRTSISWKGEIAIAEDFNYAIECLNSIPSRRPVSTASPDDLAQLVLLQDRSLPVPCSTFVHRC